MQTTLSSANHRLKNAVGIIALGLPTTGFAQADALVSDDSKLMTVLVFLVLFGLTVWLSFYAGRNNKTVGDFYTAGGTLTPSKNGLAIAGDYLSAAAFLGVSGLIAIYGLDGITYVLGFFISFIPVLLLIAEPCRNLGRYTLGDILAYRNNFRATKTVVAISSILVALFYMVPQIVGGAVVIKAIVGVPYEWSVIGVGLSMLVYVMFGGMRATTAVQVLKAILLIGFCFILVVLSWIPYGFDIGEFFRSVIGSEGIQEHVIHNLLKDDTLAAVEAGKRFMEPGLFLKSPFEQASLGLALVLGTAAMPHILMRFFTVPTASDARISALYAMAAIGFCHLLIIVIGFAAAVYVGPELILAFDKGGNLAAPILAQTLGGGSDSMLGNFMLAFIASVAFATIVAVVAGLTLAAASALAHDVYVGAIKSGHASDKEQNTAARIATLAMAIISIIAGIAAKGQNVAHLVGLGYAVAASANLPALIMTLYWRRCSTGGVVAAVVGGTVLSIGMVLVSPNMTYPLEVKAAAQARIEAITETLAETDNDAKTESHTQAIAELEQERQEAQAVVNDIADDATSWIGLKAPLVELRNPGIITIPIGFLLVIVFSLLFPSNYSQARWEELVIRREIGAQASKLQTA